MLVDEYFSKEQFDLISVCGMVNTHTAAGWLMMLNLANYAQYERELIAERTCEAMQHMKAQGVRLGVAPYGYKHSQQLHWMIMGAACSSRSQRCKRSSGL